MSNNLDEAKQAILKLLTNKIVAYHVEYATIGGGAASGLFLSQLLYWYGRSSDKEEGWIYKTQAEWAEETGLTRREQETARNRLRKKGILEEKRDGMPARLYFRPNINRIIKLLSAPKQPSKPRQITAKQECTKPPIKDGGNVHTRKAETCILAINSKPTSAVAPTLVKNGPEITTEITTEINNSDDYSLELEQLICKITDRTTPSYKDMQIITKLVLDKVPRNIVFNTIQEMLDCKPKDTEIKTINYFVKEIHKRYDNQKKASESVENTTRFTNELLERRRKVINGIL